MFAGSEQTAVATVHHSVPRPPGYLWGTLDPSNAAPPPLIWNPASVAIGNSGTSYHHALSSLLFLYGQFSSPLSQISCRSSLSFAAPVPRCSSSVFDSCPSSFYCALFLFSGSAIKFSRDRSEHLHRQIDLQLNLACISFAFLLFTVSEFLWLGCP